MGTYGAILGQRNGVQTVNSIPPDVDGNVDITAETVEALPIAGGKMTGVIDMSNQKITNLPTPTANGDAVPKNYVDPLRKDYIVAEGTSDIWHYRKWNSGIAECWGTKEYSSQGTEAWGSLYQTPDAGYAPVRYPFDFIENPKCSMTINEVTPAVWITFAAAQLPIEQKQYTPPFYLTRAKSGTVTTPEIAYYVIGKWK